MIKGEKILVVGTGLVGYPVARELVKQNEVHGLSLFDLPGERARVEQAGIKPIQLDLGSDAIDKLPTDFARIFFFVMAHAKDHSWERSIEVNALSLGRVVAHCKPSRGVFYTSSVGVYGDKGQGLIQEDTGPLGITPLRGVSTYPLTKLAGEHVITFVTRQLQIPAVIARLNVPYSRLGGYPAQHLDAIVQGRDVPVGPDRPNWYRPIFESDIAATAIGLMERATQPPTIVNWGGSDRASIEEWSEYMAGLVGKQVKFAVSDQVHFPKDTDTSRMESLVRKTRVPWREGMQLLVAARYPELLQDTVGPSARPRA